MRLFLASLTRKDFREIYVHLWRFDKESVHGENLHEQKELEMKKIDFSVYWIFSIFCF